MTTPAFGFEADPRSGGTPELAPPVQPPPPPGVPPPAPTVTTPTFSSPTASTPGVGVTKSDQAKVNALRADQLEAALASIRATFGGNISQQRALLAELNPDFRRLQEDNRRNRGFAGDAAFNSGAERGIFQSGITKEAYGRATAPYTEAIADARAQRGVDRQNIRSNIEQLRAQRRAKVVEARLASESDALNYELYLAQQGA